MVVPTKLYVGNLPESCRKQDLASTFEKYGKLVECDIVKNYAFVHFESKDDAKQAVAELDNSDFQGSKMKVELSHSRVRQKPGMGGTNECFMCGKKGHWSKECPKRPKHERVSAEDDEYGAPPPPPFGDPYMRDPRDLYRSRDPYADLYERERYPPLDRLDRYRPYPSPYERRRLPPAPSSLDPYLRDRDPYARPPPDYYRRSPPRDPYYDLYYSRRLPPLPTPLGRLSPPTRQRPLPPF